MVNEIYIYVYNGEYCLVLKGNEIFLYVIVGMNRVEIMLSEIMY